MVCRPQARAQPEAKEVKFCQEGALSTPCYKVITKVPNDAVKKASTAVSSLNVSGDLKLYQYRRFENRAFSSWKP